MNGSGNASAVSGVVQSEAYRRRLDVFLPSREAARALTADALAEGVDRTSLSRVAADVASYTAEATAIVRDEYRPELHCAAGCAYCCRKPGVLVTIPELMRILDHVDVTFGASSRSTLTERARRYVQQLEGRGFSDACSASIPCPLLVDERCSVYDVRPLVCRGYNSTSADACRRAHDDPDVLVPIFSLIKDVTDGATVGIAQELKEFGINNALVDLGTALSIALSAGDGFPSRLAAGTAELTVAERREWAEDLWGLVGATARQLGIEV